MPTSTTPEQAATAWLKKQAQYARGWQIQVFVVRLIQLAAQISAFWFLASIVHSIVNETTPVQQAVPFSNTHNLLPLILAMFTWAACAFIQDTMRHSIKTKLEHKLEGRLHHLLESQQLALTKRYSSTFWQQLFLINVPDMGEFLTQYSIQKWLAGVGPIVVLLVIFPINYVVATTMLITMPIVPLFMILVGKGAAAIHSKHFVALERLGDMFSDRLKALSLITVTGQHPVQLKRLSHASDIVNRNTMRVVSIAFLSTTVLDFFATVAIALVAVFIGFSLLGELSIGPTITLQLGLFMLLVAPLLFSELRTLGRYYHQKAKAEAAAQRIAPLFEEDHHQHNPASNMAWLNFTVDEPHLRAKKLSLQNQQWTRLTGNSGAGKTVLLEALCGFRAASHCLQGKVGLLTQQVAVLNKSLRDNMTLGHTIADSLIIQALHDVDLSNWLANLENGLDTVLGDNAALSGGEAQRLSLARIMLMNKDIILLDEPTAHLTHQQHEHLSALIHQKLKHKTVVWASHKPLPETWFSQTWHIHNHIIEVQS